ncbi:hypothetical protein ZHAS_00007854 [Anopheles sinensis]|uniref:Uncharacterized protein n=1 Tax=Anopheles sinensis TaxID=74873 RepID=A0A084VQY7_ANOSI|nr:hypothetical protein ZHAS_00007854 [Anopheles sinensis]
MKGTSFGGRRDCVKKVVPTCYQKPDISGLVKEIKITPPGVSVWTLLGKGLPQNGPTAHNEVKLG